ncbi:hypothetical protein [Rhizobium glycinendophyticum]|uniref:Uncharacterized protein n=1 Tax=Rhizobium glycinendophyticum TaxID=2589807 RepID=A0A504UHZ2_9HYPH|nr:hypothetical protein [Rhizobium glycinendophyticum]TPP10385.1 hypothetical protein FJQ55_05890 [Rhizobium glycinendophyticum]
MTTDDIRLGFLAQQSKLQMEELRQVRKDLADIMRLLNGTYDLARRIERRETELRDDIELMVKMELGGSLANMQTTMDNALSRSEASIGDVSRPAQTIESTL